MTVELTILVPAYNEAESLPALARDLAARLNEFPPAEILVIDDGSADGTAAAVPSGPPFRVVRHLENKGNGACVKTGLVAAQGRWVAVIDADGQHRVDDLLRLVRATQEGWDLAVGARKSLGRQRRGWGNVLLSLFASYLAGRPVPDLTSGLRVLRRDRALEFLHLYPNGFSFPSTSTLAFLHQGYAVRFLDIAPIPRKTGVSKIRALRDGLRFGSLVFRIATLFNPLKTFLPLCGLLFALGGLWTARTFMLTRQMSAVGALFFLSAALVLVAGLLADQIAQLRLSLPLVLKNNKS